MRKLIPNVLTLLRIAFVPVFIWFCFLDKTPNGMIWATIIFILASITDYFDGLLARSLNAVTTFGKIMDPLADKLLVLSALSVLTFRLHYVSLTLYIIIAFREVLVSILREFFAARKVFIPANIWGKIKTVFQMIGITITLLYHSYSILFEISNRTVVISTLIIQIIFTIVAFLTIFSGLVYFICILRRKF